MHAQIHTCLYRYSCTSVCIYTNISIQTSAFTYAWLATHMHTYIYTYTFMHVCYIQMYLHAYNIYVCLQSYIYVCIHILLDACICTQYIPVCIHTYLHMSQGCGLSDKIVFCSCMGCFCPYDRDNY